MVENLPAVQETRVGKIPWRREWLPTPVFLPGESHGQRSLAGHSPWGRSDSGETERGLSRHAVSSHHPAGGQGCVVMGAVGRV